jgi:PHD/YefM family antitoxin component YafN of YafNO toxin-antitoxin module
MLTFKCTFKSTDKEVAMPHILSIMEARKQLTSLPETLLHNGQPDVLEITRRGKPVLAVLPWELYEAVSETLEVMGDRELMAQLRQSISEMDSGKLTSWQDAKQELGL